MATFKRIFLLFSLLCLHVTQSKSFADIPASNHSEGSCIVQKHSPLPDIENTNNTPGILQALKLYERSFAGPVTLKLSKKPGFHAAPNNLYLHTAAYFKTYHYKRINNLGATPLYISVRSIVI